MSHNNQGQLLETTPQSRLAPELRPEIVLPASPDELEPDELQRIADEDELLPSKAAEAISNAFSGRADDRLTGHNYDGIQEYDNPLPAWWTWLFVASLIFGIAYAFVSLVMQEGWGARNSYVQAVQAEQMRQLGDIGVLEPTRETYADIMATPKLNIGRGIFIGNCASCHGNNGQGSLTAPNLTDDAYINVKKVEDIHDVVANGRKNGAMPAWRNRLSSNEVILVTSYVASLKGTNVAGGKAAEGTNIEGDL